MARVGTVAIAYDCLFPYTTGGGERQYRAFAEEMARQGLSVDYLTAVQWDGPTPDTGSFRIIPVSGRLRLYSPDGVRRASAALRYAAGLFRSLRRRRGRYDAVLVSGLPVFNVFAARLALWGTPTSIVVDYLEVWHRRQWVEYAGRLAGTLAWLLQRMAIAVTPVATCHSQLSATRLRREGLRTEPIVSPGLIDGNAKTNEVVPADSPPYVLYAGRHISDKRVEALPAAVAVARRRLPGLRLVILGTGPTTPAVHNAVAQAGGQDWTDFPGFVSDDRLEELFRGALCLANPSRREGYGLVVVESCAHGTPVVLVRDEGNAATELISEGVNGFVAAAAAPSDIAEAIAAVAEAGTGLRESTRAWYDEAVRTRSIERTVQGILSHLDRITTARRTMEEGNT